MKLLASEAAKLVGGRLEGPDVTVDGAGIDSRVLPAGALFVPIVAERDGHDYIDDALAAGAAAYLTMRKPREGSAIVVPDTTATLSTLGAWARDRIHGPVVAITGSAGKTSTKDLVGAVLRAEMPTAVSERSFNNEIGVPLTLFNADGDVRAAVVEMGARGFGHIAWLCEMARPTVGVVTNVAAAHTEMFGDLDGVAKAKGELVEALPSTGTAVLNADDERVSTMAARTSARVLTFGVEHGDVRVEGIQVDDELRVTFRLRSPWGDADVQLEARGAHQAMNAAAAASAALALDIPLDHIVPRLRTAPLSPWRMEVSRSRAGILVINDSYNANPASMGEALKALALTPAARRIAVIGPMLELGVLSDAEHARIGELARSLGLDRVIAVAAPAYGAEDVASVDEALGRLSDLGRGDAVLVKASRAAGLERVAAAVLGEADS